MNKLITLKYLSGNKEIRKTFFLIDNLVEYVKSMGIESFTVDFPSRDKELSKR